MSWLRRRRKRADPALDRADEHLPPLSVGEATRLTTLARAAFAAEGLVVVPDGRGALVGDQRTFGLTNLAAIAAQHPRRRWPRLARQHARRIVVAHQASDAEGDGPEVRSRILVKLRPLDDLTGPVGYAPEILPGIVALVAIDHPDHVRELLSDQAVDELGGWEQLREVAIANLRALGPPDHELLRADPDRPDSTVHVFGTDDFFGAARVAILPEILSQVGIERPSHGVLLAVPHRHLLLVHPVEGAGVVPAVQLMVRLATTEFHGHTGPVSPQVFYRSADGQVQQVTVPDQDNRTIAVRVDGPFAKAFDALGIGPDQ